jgi:hypothetical protein
MTVNGGEGIAIQSSKIDAEKTTLQETETIQTTTGSKDKAAFGINAGCKPVFWVSMIHRSSFE